MKAMTCSGRAPSAPMALERAGAGLRRGAPPAGVHDGQHAGLGVEQGDGDAVGDEDGQRRIQSGRDEDVGRGDGIVHPPGAPAPLGGAHDGRPGAVHLFGEDQVVRARRRRRGRPAPG